MQTLSQILFNNVTTIHYTDGNMYTGGVRNRMPHGKGVLRYADGGVFEGTFQDGELSGQGVMRWNDVFEYNGNWSQNLPNGPGKLFYRKQLRASGMFDQGNLHGYVQYFHLNGTLAYKGNYERGVPHGDGTQYTENGEIIYQGTWKHGRRCGHGKAFQSEKVLYDGEWMDNARHGQGKEYNMAGNLIFCGCWENGQRVEKQSVFENQKLKYHGYLNAQGFFHGFGTLFSIHSGRVLYEGQFRNGTYHGYGVVYHDEGAILYEGEFSRGFYQGRGKLYNDPVLVEQCYLLYEGEFVRGKCHGRGTWYYASGAKKWEGMFRENNFLGRGKEYYVDGTLRYEGLFSHYKFHGHGRLFRSNGNLEYYGKFRFGFFHGRGCYYPIGERPQKGLFQEGQYVNVQALKIQSFLDQNITKPELGSVRKTELQAYLRQRYNILPKAKDNKMCLYRQIQKLFVSENHKRMTQGVEENEEQEIDIFGNEITIPCIGNDNGIYDLSSMEYLFRKNEDDEYCNIPYVYDESNERVPNFPIMNEGKRLSGYYCDAISGSL